MLRTLVVALLALNLLLAMWMQGWLDGLVSRPGEREREPARLARQVNAHTIRVAPLPASAPLPGREEAAADLSNADQPREWPPEPAAPASAASAAEKPVPAPAPRGGGPSSVATAADAVQAGICLQSGPFSGAEVAAVERSMQEPRMAGIEWRGLKTERGGAYLVYMGKFVDRAALLKRAEELRRAGLATEELKNSPGLEPGLSLGRHGARADADAALAKAMNKGARTARVVVITPATPVLSLRVDKADPEQAARLAQVRLGAAGLPFTPCAAAGDKG